ncbi:MAG: response regulator [Actinobacteria bacterium]|nr:response regulator [Actinomycetota bacterium]
MGKTTPILIVEDTQDDYNKIYKFLTINGYTVYPQNNDFNKYLENVQNYVKDTNELSKYNASEYLNNFFKDMNPELIILDIQLLPKEGDRSGLKFLPFLRNQYPYVPILILTIHTFGEISAAYAGDNKANYYLCKILNNENLNLSEEFFNTRLAPVINMLLYWHRVSYSTGDIHDSLKSHMEELFAYLEKEFCILKYDINQISNNLHDLKNHTEILLRVAQYNIASNDKKATEMIEKFIDEFSLITNVPKISQNKTELVISLRKAKTELVKIVKKEIDKDIGAFISETFKEIIGADEDESVTKAVLLSLCKGIGKVWKFYRTGDF